MTIQRRLDEIRGTAAAPKATRVKPEQDPEPEPGGTSIGDKIAAVLAESEEGMNTPAIAKAIGQPATIKNFATWRHAVSRALREEPKRFRKIGAGHATRYRLGGTAAAPKAQAPPEQASTPAPPDNDPAAASRADSIAAVLAEAGRAMAVAEIANEVGQPASITSWDAWRVAIGRRLRADPKRFTVTGAGRSTRYALR